jgi:CheY-like chemotaxis protein
MAHEFGKLLNATLVCIEDTLATLEPEASARRPIERLHEVATRGQSFVEQILQLARPDLLELEPVHIDGVVEFAADWLQRLLGANLRLELDLRAGDAHVATDRGQLDQILFNLASNARDAMPSGGRLRIESRVIEANALHTANRAVLAGQPRVLLAISDTGPGMDDEAREQALQPFAAGKRPSSGAGIGLSMVANVMASSGGHMQLQSAPGHGTTVFLYWPRWEPKPPAPVLSLVRPPAAQVLLVHDDRHERVAIRRQLEQAGCNVMEASSAATALELLRHDPAHFDLLMAEVELPDLTGAELARQARFSRPDLTPLFISRHSRQELLERGWLAADAIVVHHPARAEEIEQALRVALSAASEH